MLYSFRTRLSKAYIANVPFTKSARTFVCCTKFFIFSLKISRDFAFLISQGSISHILGPKEDRLSVPKYIVRFLCLCRVKWFLRLYIFCLKWKVSFIISGPKSFLILKISVAKICRFFGEYLLICPFLAHHQKRDLFHLFRQVLKLFQEKTKVTWINFVIETD